MLRMVLGSLIAAGIVLVGLQIVALLLDDPQAVDPDAPPPGGVVELSANEAVRVHVHVDGQEVFNEVLCRGDVSCKQSFGPAREIAVDLPDLNRATVRYNGRRVKPLGTLDEPRTLVFVDDTP